MSPFALTSISNFNMSFLPLPLQNNITASNIASIEDTAEKKNGFSQNISQVFNTNSSWGNTSSKTIELEWAASPTDDKEKFKLITSFVNTLVKESIDLDPKFSKIVDDNFWDLV